MNIQHLYLRSGLFSLGGKMIAAISALVIVWLITSIGGKAVFGEVMIAYALNFVMGTTIAAQFQTVLVYHVSRDHGKTEHREKLGAALFYTLLTGLLIVLAETYLASPIAALMNKPELSFWISSMAWLVPAFSLNSILCSWYRAKQDVPTMVMHLEVWPNILRLLFLTLLFATVRNPAYIPAAYVFSYLLSFLALYMRNPVRPRMSPRFFTRWDMTYSAQMMLAHLMSKSLNNIVIFFLGIFASATIVADYALAMRFTQFLQLPKAILAQIHVPRMGMQIENREREEFMAEFSAVRSLILAATIMGAAFIILLMPAIFVMFPDFKTASELFVLLSLSAIIMSAFGNSGYYLGIAGHAGSALLVHAISMLAIIVSIILLVPLFGGQGAATATIIGSAVLSGLTAFQIFKKDKIKPLNYSAFFQMLICSLTLVLASLGLITLPAASFILILVAVAGLLEARPIVRLLLPF